MGKDELGDALMDFSKHIHVATLSNMGGAHACESYARDAEQYLMEAKSAILSWFLENLPKEIKTAEEDKDRVLYQQYVEGWNSCLAEIKRRIG